MDNMIFNCLLIDDSDQEHVIERIESLGQKAKVEIKCYEFNVGNQKLPELFYDKGKISIDNVIKAFHEKFDGIQLQLIAFDYDLEDAEEDIEKKVTGLTLINKIGELRKGSFKILYSSEMDDLIKTIVEQYNKSGNLKIAKDNIRSLFLNGIVDFAGKEDYDKKIVDIIAKNKNRIPLNNFFENKLREYGNMTFKNIYPPFKGRTLKEIAKIMDSDPDQGHDFKKEMIDQLVTYLINLNDE